VVARRSRRWRFVGFVAAIYLLSWASFGITGSRGLDVTVTPVTYVALGLGTYGLLALLPR
jgi:hypothetical protein